MLKPVKEEVIFGLATQYIYFYKENYLFLNRYIIVNIPKDQSWQVFYLLYLTPQLSEEQT